MERTNFPLGKRPVIVSVTALLLACAHNYFFFGAPLGVSYPLFVLLFYLFFFAQTKNSMNRLWDFSWFLFVVIVAISMTYVLYTNPLFYVLNFLAVPVLIAIHTTVLASTRTIRWFEPRMLWNVLDHLFPQSFRHMPKPFRLITGLVGSKLDSPVKSTIGKVFIGIAVSLPLLCIVIGLLSSADRAFGQLLSGIPDFLDEISIGEGLLRFVWIFVAFLFLFGYVWGFIEQKTYDWENSQRPERREPARVGFDPVIVLTVLIAINLVYLLFAAVQFSYLFGAWSGELPDGTTYAEHARSGFFELVAVAVINFGILIGSITFTREHHMALLRWNRIWLSSLVACTGVMLVSAFVRLHLYEEVYGYTYIRFLVHAFMIYLGILLLVSGCRIWRTRLSLLRSFTIISLLAYVIVNYAGMDSIIADKNIERFRENGRMDIAYLEALSLETVPQLIELSKEKRELIGILRKKYENLQQDERDWRSFNLSRYRAEQALGSYFKSHNDVTSK